MNDFLYIRWNYRFQKLFQRFVTKCSPLVTGALSFRKILGCLSLGGTFSQTHVNPGLNMLCADLGTVSLFGKDVGRQDWQIPARASRVLSLKFPVGNGGLEVARNASWFLTIRTKVFKIYENCLHQEKLYCQLRGWCVLQKKGDTFHPILIFLSCQIKALF